MAWTVKVVPAEGETPPATTPPATTPPPTTPPATAPPQTSGGGYDADALAKGDFRSVGGIDATEQHGGDTPGYQPVTVPPNASVGTRMLAPVQNVVRAFQARQGPFPAEAPPGPGEPPDMGVPTTRDIGYGAKVAGYGMSAPGNVIGAVGDVAGHPNFGTAGKYLFDIVAPLMGGLYGVYQRAAAGEPEALTAWNRATQAVSDWRAAQATRAGEVTAARTAQETNTARTAAAEGYDAATAAENARRTQAAADYAAQTGRQTTPRLLTQTRTTPRLLDVPEVNPLQTPAPPMATRMLAQTPQPAGAPTFAQWLAGTVAPAAGRQLWRGGRTYLYYKLGAKALRDAIQSGNPPPGEPG